MRRSERNGNGSATPSDPQPDLDPAWIDRVRSAMLRWFDLEGRSELPWRSDRDPYKVLVAEVMLVQTTVAAAGPFFERFIRRFPDVEALASADEAEVLKAWEGLGYYRRARLLQRAAREIADRHEGRVPDDPAALLALPGVGRYIAGAVSSIAFDLPEPILEANTQRVLSRWLRWPEDVRSSASQARLWQAAARLVPPEGPGRFNQAIMDLGAIVCTSRAPRCLACPVAEDCLARIAGLQDELPRRSAPKPPLDVVETCVLAVDPQDRFLVVRRAEGGLWERFWEFPTVHQDGADPAGRGAGEGADAPIGDRFRNLTGVSIQIGPTVHSLSYSVTKHRVVLSAVSGVPTGGEPAPGPGLSEVGWLTLDELDLLSRTGATRRLSTWARATPEALRPAPGLPG